MTRDDTVLCFETMDLILLLCNWGLFTDSFMSYLTKWGKAISSGHLYRDICQCDCFGLQILEYSPPVLTPVLKEKFVTLFCPMEIMSEIIIVMARPGVGGKPSLQWWKCCLSISLGNYKSWKLLAIRASLVWPVFYGVVAKPLSEMNWTRAHFIAYEFNF